jgi:hypothetical protein
LPPVGIAGSSKNLAAAIVQGFFRFRVGVAVELFPSAGQRIEQNLGIFHQIVVDDPLDRLPLLGRNFR